MDALPEAQREREMRELELALLHRGVSERAARRQLCAGCQRSPLVGERVYVREGGVILCELCRSREADLPACSVFVHGPEFGHTLKLRDRQAA
jgi:hypothetical protein